MTAKPMLGFPTKQALEKKLSQLINNKPTGYILEGEDDKLVRRLLELHNDYENKVGTGIQHIEVGDSSHWNNRIKRYNRCFYIRRTDGTRVNFSYVKILAGKTRKLEPKKRYDFQVEPAMMQQLEALNLELPPEPLKNAHDFIETNEGWKKTGVYFMWETNGQIAYVGKSRNIYERISQHDFLTFKTSALAKIGGSGGNMNYDNSKKKKRHRIYVSYIEVPDHEVDLIELLYIGILRPLVNGEAKAYHKHLGTQWKI